MIPCLSLRWTLLLAFTGFLTTGAEILIQGKVGEDITLPCYYSAAYHGTTTSCWGRGSCPTSWCSDPIVWTDAYQKIYPQSSNYHLMGDIWHGNVSLTILNVTEKDAGRYCCRVEIPGWFNDIKSNIQVVIEKAFIGPTTVDFGESSFTLEPRWMSTTESPPDNGSLYDATLMKEQRKKEPGWTGLYIGTGVCLVLLAIVSLLLLKWYLRKKQKMTNSISQVAFSNSETAGVQSVLEAGVHAPENIYEFN